MRAFPAPEDVFFGDVIAHRKVLQPLLSIDAAAVDPTWSGQLHFVSPIEPERGYGLLGEGAEAFYEGSLSLNWIAFHVRDSLYEFVGDFRYFAINREHRAQLAEQYAEEEADFQKISQGFRVADVFPFPGPDLGGGAWSGSWCDYGLRVEAEGELREIAHPLTPDGRRFRFVGWLEGVCCRANAVLLFYDPANVDCCSNVRLAVI